MPGSAGDDLEDIGFEREAVIIVSVWSQLRHQSTLVEDLWCTSGMNVWQLDVRDCAAREDQVADLIVAHEQSPTRSRKMLP